MVATSVHAVTSAVGVTMKLGPVAPQKLLRNSVSRWLAPEYSISIPKVAANFSAPMNPFTKRSAAGKCCPLVSPLPQGKAGSICTVAPGKFSPKNLIISGIRAMLRSVMTL